MAPIEEFIACFSEVSDPRQDNVRRNLYEFLIIGLCTMLCGGKDCSDMGVFGRAKGPFLRLTHGIPAMTLSAGYFANSILSPSRAVLCAPWSASPKGWRV